MAFQMSFTDQYGTVYQESYWRVVQTNICQSEKKGLVMFYGYENAANKGKRVIGEKAYVIDKDAYEASFDADSLNPNGVNPVLAAYLHAAGTMDVGIEIKTCFFAGALSV